MFLNKSSNNWELILNGLDNKIFKLLQSFVFLEISWKYLKLRFFSVIEGTLLLGIFKLKKFVSEIKALISFDFWELNKEPFWSKKEYFII